uniref:Uncharacterized protein n=1 Tax=Octopus bimaculoides TaxID=37653 RepID=A0A0L8FIH5_OCTBM
MALSLTFCFLYFLYIFRYFLYIFLLRPKNFLGPSVLKFSWSYHLYEDNVNYFIGGGCYCCFIVDRSYENAVVIFLFVLSGL